MPGHLSRFATQWCDGHKEELQHSMLSCAVPSSCSRSSFIGVASSCSQSDKLHCNDGFSWPCPSGSCSRLYKQKAFLCSALIRAHSPEAFSPSSFADAATVAMSAEAKADIAEAEAEMASQAAQRADIAGDNAEGFERNVLYLATVAGIGAGVASLRTLYLYFEWYKYKREVARCWVTVQNQNIRDAALSTVNSQPRQPDG
mmetsp:Transcript_24218/g.53254  ORF Transcript_24218/g.53254 Transcript_24218/m.53254 type:complete len:201 (-) Transcript_24218:15-617(-)